VKSGSPAPAGQESCLLFITHLGFAIYALQLLQQLAAIPVAHQPEVASQLFLKDILEDLSLVTPVIWRMVQEELLDKLTRARPETRSPRNYCAGTGIAKRNDDGVALEMVPLVRFAPYSKKHHRV
jgi:hypothetical protein